MANTGGDVAKDRILGSAIKINLIGANGAVNQSPVVEVDRFEAKPTVSSVEHWPSGAGRARTQFTGIKMRVTIDIGRRGSGIFPILKILKDAVQHKQQVPMLQLTRYATTDYAGSFTELYKNGTIVDGSLSHGKGNETASDTLVIDFDDFD